MGVISLPWHWQKAKIMDILSFLPCESSLPEGQGKERNQDTSDILLQEVTCYRRWPSTTGSELPLPEALFSYRKWPSLTGSLCKPSLQDLRRHKVTPVRNVALRYHRPDNTLEDVMFVLLKTSTRKRVQHQRPEGKWTDFSLRNVTGNDTGNYSCICYQTKAPWPHIPVTASKTS